MNMESKTIIDKIKKDLNDLQKKGEEFVQISALTTYLDGLEKNITSFY